MDEGSRPVPVGSNPSPTSALRELVQVAQAMPATIGRRAGLSHNELAVLDLLSDAPRGPSEIARTLSVTSAAASGIVNRLVARGHAQRMPHEGDRRRTDVEFSESGRAEILGHLMPMLVALGEVDARLTDDEREVVTRYLEEATAAIRHVL